MKGFIGPFLNILLIFVLDSNYVFSENQLPDNESELVFSSILFRHGDRTPEKPYAKDPYGNTSLWPVGWGMLTNKGKAQHYQLGQWLRKRYDNLIPDKKYSHDLIYIQSTDVDRTLMSALANLAGMFYPTQKEIWSDLKWQPIPVHTVPQHLDKVLSMNCPCPKYEEEYEAFKRSPVISTYNEKHKELYRYLTEHAGDPIHGPIHTEYLYSNLFIETINNFTLPNWTETVFPDKMYPVAAFSFVMPTMTRTLKRLKGGPLLKEMITHMKQKRAGTLSPNRNLWIYSAHDTTVANFLNTIGVFEVHAPPFAATVLVELRKSKTNDYFVSVFYKNTTEEPTLLTVPGCNAACPLDKFTSLLSDVIPVDWDSECHSHQLFDLTSDQPYNSLAIFAMVTSTLLVFLLLAMTSLYWHKQKPTVHLYKKLNMETL